MMIFPVNLEFDRTDKKSIAKTLFNYFLAQYADTTRRQVIGGAELASMRVANEEYRKHEEFGGGWSNDPYSDLQIKNKEVIIKRLSEEVADAQAIINFMRDRFLEGMI